MNGFRGVCGRSPFSSAGCWLRGALSLFVGAVRFCHAVFFALVLVLAVVVGSQSGPRLVAQEPGQPFGFVPGPWCMLYKCIYIVHNNNNNNNDARSRKFSNLG